MRPEWSRLDRAGQAAQVWAESRDRFLGRVVGPHFEALCREWVRHYAVAETFGGSVSQVGRGVVNDAAHRRSHEVDLVVTGSEGGVRRPLLAIGEAKWGETVGQRHLDRLRRIRQVLAGRNDLDTSATRVVLFGGAGFTDEVRATADEAADVALVDLDTLYRAG